MMRHPLVTRYEPSPYRLSIEIPGLPKPLNNTLRLSWRVRYNETKKWKRIVGLLCLGKTPRVPLKRARLRITRASSVQPDFDGLVGSAKALIDGLIEAGILENDRMANIGQPDYRWEKVSPGHGFVRLEVEAVE